MKKNIKQWFICGIILGGLFAPLALGDAQANDKIFEKKVKELFPTWTKTSENSPPFPVSGVQGEPGDEKLLMHYIPDVISVLLKFVAPIVLIMFVYSGFRFIYAGSNEEDVTKSKEFFMYSLIGIALVILSYSLIKVLYFVLSS
jgi:hypothetical protein